MRIIRVSCCCNCYYQEVRSDHNKQSYWVCMHPEKKEAHIGDDEGMEAQPEWCPLEKEPTPIAVALKMYKALLLVEANLKKTKTMKRTLAVVRDALSVANKTRLQ